MSTTASRRNLHLTLALVLALSSLAGCARGVRGSAPDVGADRAEYPVTVFTNDATVGKHLLELIRERGYTHQEGEVLANPNDEFNIKWGGAPLAMVQELATLVKQAYGHELRMLQVFEPGDTDIFINMPLGGSSASDDGASESTAAPLSPEEITRQTVHIVIFCDDEAVARETLAQFQALGYTNPENSFQGMPNDNFNIKWGAASAEIVEELVVALEKRFSTEFRRSPEFAVNDLDVFINLPVAPAGTGI
jgi:hypothetical protein